MAEIFSLRALQAFEAAARLGSFALAAEELRSSPGAVSQLIRGLEYQTGRRLFDRARRSILLNEAGREALPRLSAAFQDIRETSQILRHRIAPSQLVISVPPSVATGWLPRKLADFLALEPDVSLRLRGDHSPLDLEAQQIDMRLSQETFPNEVARVVSEVPEGVLAVCTKTYFDQYNANADYEFFPRGSLISTYWGASRPCSLLGWISSGKKSSARHIQLLHRTRHSQWRRLVWALLLSKNCTPLNLCVAANLC